MAGQSGAVLNVSDDSVFKRGVGVVGDRVLAQGKWLAQHRSAALVQVRDVHDASGHSGATSWYQMERLYELPWQVVSAERLAVEVLGLLARHVWCEKSETLADDWDCHLEYVQHRCEEQGVDPHDLTEWGEDVAKFYEDVQHWPSRCLVHGDPTFSNVMMNQLGAVKLIDPIPTPKYMPSVYTVDVGKVLQSMTGYETLRFGTPCIADDDEVMARLAADSQILDAARYFCLVHYVRLLRYVDDLDTRDELRRKYDRLRSRWRPS